MKKILLLSLILFGVKVFSQDTVNYLDVNSQRQGKWIVRGDEAHKFWYRPDQIVQTGSYINNKKTGTWTEYYMNNNLKSEITFVNGFPKGRLVVYDSLFSRRVLAEGVFENGFFVPKKP